MATHVMLDLETFGQGNNAAIISIGAVKFNATEILDRFLVGVEPESSQAAGLTIDASTVKWWLDPERQPAWAEWLKLEKDDLGVALDGFSIWVGRDQMRIWGNGTAFDNVIMRNAYERYALDYPAPFWLDSCYRTVESLAPDVRLERVGVHHSPADDAESQARHLMRIAEHLGVVL